MIVGIVFKTFVALDPRQNLAAIHFRQVQIQQDKIRARRIGVIALALQKGHGVDAVDGDVQVDGLVERRGRLPESTGHRQDCLQPGELL